MSILVVETFVLMAVFVAVGVLAGIVLRQLFDRPETPAFATAGAAPPPDAPAEVAAPVVVHVARPDAGPEEAAVEPIAPAEAPAEAPALPPIEAAPPADAAADTAALPAADAVIDPGKAALADQVGARPAALAGPRDGRPDDLKRIKGIGPQNEARLNALGVYHFDQIAAWSPEEARWIGSYLAFPGRIEREDWIAQAAALSAG